MPGLRAGAIERSTWQRRRVGVGLVLVDGGATMWVAPPASAERLSSRPLGGNVTRYPDKPTFAPEGSMKESRRLVCP